MREGRADDELRPISLDLGVNRWAEGSAFVRWGDTHVLATLSVEDRLPPGEDLDEGSHALVIRPEHLQDIIRHELTLAHLDRATQEKRGREVIGRGR